MSHCRAKETSSRLFSFSAAPFSSSCPQSFPASGSFPVSWLFTSGGQSIGVSASASVLPMNTQDWSPLGWTGWISLPPQAGKLTSLVPHKRLPEYPIVPREKTHTGAAREPFSFCLQSSPASRSFPVSWLFTSGGQSIGVSASASSPSNEYSGLISFRIDWLALLVVHTQTHVH